jgi:hypothetical protein
MPSATSRSCAFAARLSSLPVAIRLISGLLRGVGQDDRGADAWDQYVDPDKRRDNAGREETAHRVAWAAVKQSYEKQDDRWVKKT